MSSEAHTPRLGDDTSDQLRDAFETIAREVDDEQISDRWGYRPLQRLEDLEDDR